MTARQTAGQEIAQNDHLSPDDHGKGVCPAHLSTGKHVFTVAVEVEHSLIEGPAQAANGKLQMSKDHL